MSHGATPLTGKRADHINTKVDDTDSRNKQAVQPTKRQP